MNDTYPGRSSVRVRGGRTLPIAIGALALALALVGCSSGGDDEQVGDTQATDDAVSSTTTVARPDGPAADLSEELSGGDGVFIGSPEPYEPEAGYAQSEYVATGTADSYVAVGGLSPDGEWELEPDASAEYRTRIVVRRPEDPEDFSGTVLVEWLNVSGGVDADPEFTTLREEVVRQGHAWVGVSAQLIGVEGGPVLVAVDVPGAEAAGKGLKVIDPERYGSLAHPGDAYAYDIYTQVARSLRVGAPATDDLEVTDVLAVGESQSAFALVTYLNGVQPLTQAFDGFFVHSRGGAAFPLPAEGESADLAGSIGGEAVVFRSDLDVPVMNLQAENDVVGVLGSAAARQPDSDTFRLWEVAGTAHADRHLTGELTVESIDCGVPINDAPFHVVGKAALRHLVTWVESGEPPPMAARLELSEGDAPDIQRDPDGIAQGGVRTPPVDVPVQVLSGVPGPNTDVICLLLGSTRPLAADRIAELYASTEEYQEQYDAAVDEAIEAGYVLDADRAALDGYARPDLISG
jgi:hypothetical protein